MNYYASLIVGKNAPINLNIETLAITQHSHEKLDSGLITVPLSERKTRYPRWSKVSLLVGHLEFNMFVWGDEVHNVVKGNNPLYEHQLTLIEPTKWLERFMLPYITFIQPLFGDKYTMKDVVERIIRISPVMPSGMLHANTRACRLSAQLAERLDGIIAPQFFLEPSNMREALISVLSYVNAIPRMNMHGVLDATFFNEYEEQIVVFDTASYQESVDSEEYATTLETTIPVLTGSKDDKRVSARVMSRKDVVGVRSRDPIMGDENWYVQLPYKMQELQKLELYIGIWANPSEADPIYKSTYVDLTNYIFPKQEYDALLASGSDFTARKTHAIWYEQNNNYIDGFTTPWGAFGVLPSIMNILAEVMALYVDPDYPEYLFEIQPGHEWYNYLFRVTYVPVLDSRIHIEREDIHEINMNSIIVGNIRGDVSDIQNITTNMYGRIQRLGLAPVLRANIYVDTTMIRSMNSYTVDDEVITDREIIGFPDFVAVRYETTPRFNRLSLFLAVDRQFRALQVLPDAQIVTRREIVKDYIIIDTENKENLSMISHIQTFMQVFENINENYSANIAYIEIDSGETAKLLMPCVSMGGQSTMLFELKFPSPNIAGNAQIEQSSRRVMKAIPYTKEDGSFDHINIRLYDYFYGTKVGEEDFMNDESFYQEYANDFAHGFPAVRVGDDYTVADTPPLISTGDLRIFLDTNETLVLGIQIQLLPSQELILDVVIGLNITTMNPMVTNYENDKPQLYVWLTNERYHKTENKFAKGSVSTITYTVGYNWIELSEEIPLGTHWAIADLNGNLYLAVNQSTNQYQKLYFNRMTLREGVDYSLFEATVVELYSVGAGKSTLNLIMAPNLAIELSSVGFGKSSLTLLKAGNLPIELYSAGIGKSSVSLIHVPYPAIELQSLGIGQSSISLISAENLAIELQSLGIGQSSLSLFYQPYSQESLELQSLGIGQSSLSLKVISDLGIELQSVGIGQSNLKIETDRPVEWVDGGSSLTAQNVCENETHVNNTRVKSTSTSYQWVTINSYVASTNESQAGTCSTSEHVGNTRIVCIQEGSDWLCVEQECTAVTVTEYEICQVKGL